MFPIIPHFLFVYAQIKQQEGSLDLVQKASFFASVGVLCTVERENGARTKNYNKFEKNGVFQP